jgi:hypothetical protein
MTDRRPPDTQKGPDCPPLGDEEPGLVITAPARITWSVPLLVGGTFHVTWDEAKRLPDPPHRALVLSVWAGIYQHASTPFRTAMLFPDDAEGTALGKRGSFHISVLDEAGFRKSVTWWVRVVLGTRVSNVVAVEVV